MTSTERMIIILGFAGLAVLIVLAAIAAPLTGIHWLDAVLFPLMVIVPLLALMGLIFLILTIMRRADPAWAAGGAITVDDDNNLTLFSKRFLRKGEATTTVQLDQVTNATWYISPFSRSGTLSIELWDHDPEITFQIFEFMPKQGSEPLAKISTRILKVSPVATARLQRYLEERIVAGTIECNFTPHDFKPIRESLPPLRPGVSFSADGRQIRYRKPDESRATRQFPEDNQ